MPNLISPTYFRAIRLLEKAQEMDHCAHQAIHLSHAVLHLVASLQNAIKDENKKRDPQILDRCLYLNE
jgi:hypothetical protein